MPEAPGRWWLSQQESEGEKSRFQFSTYRIRLFLNSGYAAKESICYNERVLAQLSRSGDTEKRKEDGRELWSTINPPGVYPQDGREGYDRSTKITMGKSGKVTLFSGYSLGWLWAFRGNTLCSVLVHPSAWVQNGDNSDYWDNVLVPHGFYVACNGFRSSYKPQRKDTQVLQRAVGAGPRCFCGKRQMTENHELHSVAGVQVIPQRPDG